MRILWKSAHPDMPTGYASQSALVLPRLKALGHEVAISVTAGQDQHFSFWQGIPVFGRSGFTDLGEDTVGGDYKAFNADLLVTFFCTWVTKFPEAFRDMRTIHLTPVDCNPMSIRDYHVITNSGGTPAAVSRTGLEIMRKGGLNREPLDPLLLPHGIDTRVFTPPADRAAAREQHGFTDQFVVGMNFYNNDKFRKNLQESVRGFALFHAKHPDSILCLHAMKQWVEGYNFPALIQYLGIGEAVRWSPQHELMTGLITPSALASWYGSLDVFLGAGNEGFGLPAVEAQGCGTPVILADTSTGPELAGDGWLATGEAWWNDVHQAEWLHVSPQSVADCLEEAYEDARNRREAARDNALLHDITRIVRDHWEPVLGALE
jgi:glycosyltransferase involved in cell wall biosynthesis